MTKFTATFAVSVFILYMLYLVIEPSLPSNGSFLATLANAVNVFRSLDPDLQRRIGAYAGVVGFFVWFLLATRD